MIAGYMPDPGTMTTKLIAERGTGRILGGQIIGDRAAAAKRIDTAAVAIWQSMTAEELTSMDLSHAPPFSGVWDPVQVASRRLVGCTCGWPSEDIPAGTMRGVLSPLT